MAVVLEDAVDAVGAATSSLSRPATSGGGATRWTDSTSKRPTLPCFAHSGRNGENPAWRYGGRVFDNGDDRFDALATAVSLIHRARLAERGGPPPNA